MDAASPTSDPTPRRLTLYAADGTQMVAPMTGLRWKLDSWSDYTVEGDPADVARFVDEMESGVSKRRTATTATLCFRNQVGFADGGLLGEIEVSTGKFNEGDFEAMLANITRFAARLPYAASAATAIPYDRTLAVRDDLLYHAFAYLRHIIGTPTAPSTELLGPIRSILARPHRRTLRRLRVVPVGQARRIDAAVLLDVAAGRYPLRKAPHVGLAQHMPGQLVPESIGDSVLVHDVDTAENRFVKAVLDLGVAIVRRMQRVADLDGKRPRKLLGDCDRIEAALRPLRLHPMWNEVGQMTHFPASSTVLQRRHDYRAVFQHYNRLRLGTRLPMDPKDARRLLDVKDIATLYELWCFFAVVEAVTAVLGRQPSRAVRVGGDEFASGVAWETLVAWPGGVRVTYNSTFSPSKPEGRRSYSVRLRPDVLLEVPLPAGGFARHALDAKFKVEWGAVLAEADQGGDDGADIVDPPGMFLRGDVHAMHTYRDALGLGSAWVLYPGNEFRLFGVDGVLKVEVDRLSPAVEGVGACPLPVRGNIGTLQRLLRGLLGTGSRDGVREPAKPDGGKWR